MLYCAKKNQKNQFFQVLGPRSAICLSIRLVFLRQYSTFTKKEDWFFWDSTVFLLIFLQKCCTVPKKTVFFAKVLYCPKKTKKKQSFPVLLPCEVPGPEKMVLLFFFWTVQHFSKKRLVFWDSTVFLLIFLQKCCTVPKKPIFFCKSAVLSQKKQSCGRPVVGSSLKTGKHCFFGFFGTVQQLLQKRIGFFGTVQCFC